MPKSNQVMGKLDAPKKTSADLTQNYAALAQNVLGDPSVFPDTFTAWIPRWLAQNVNFKVLASQLPVLETPKVVGATGQPAFQNSWVAFGTSDATPSFYKDAFGLVYLVGTLKSGTITGTMFTLPAGYRPQKKLILPVVSNGVLGVCTINVDGTVVATSGNNTYFSVSGLVFRAYS
jgi:hypothetical protein